MATGNAASILAGGPQRHILLLLGWYAEGVHRGIATYAHQADWALDASRVHMLHPPSTDSYDGTICIMGMDRRIDRRVTTSRKPVVNIGYHFQKDIPTVAADHEKITRMAVAYFLQRGFEKLAFYLCSGSRGEWGRMEAFRRRVIQSGAEFYLLDCRDPRHTQRASPERLKRLRKMLRRVPRPLAAMAEYDDLALDIIKACRAENIAVPEQVAVLGVNDDPLRCPFSTVPLSSVDDDLEGIGYQAAAILDGLLKGAPAPPKLTLVPPVGITTRQSTDILAISHANVATALKLIWHNYQNAFNLSELVAEVPMSYRRLHEQFNKHVGRTMAAEVRRRRTEHAMKLLIQTPAKLNEIARDSGFGDTNRLIKAFQIETGMTPGKFRKCHHRQADTERSR